MTRSHVPDLIADAAGKVTSLDALNLAAAKLEVSAMFAVDGAAAGMLMLTVHACAT